MFPTHCSLINDKNSIIQIPITIETASTSLMLNSITQTQAPESPPKGGLQITNKLLSNSPHDSNGQPVLLGHVCMSMVVRTCKIQELHTRSEEGFEDPQGYVTIKIVCLCKTNGVWKRVQRQCHQGLTIGGIWCIHVYTPDGFLVQLV